MSVQLLNPAVNAANTTTVPQTTEKKNEEVNTTKPENNKGFDDTAVVYEKTPAANSVTNKNAGIDREAIIAQMKAENDARMNQLKDIVTKMMQGQGNAFAIASDDDIWSFLASGDYTVTEAAKLQAQEDISENGYWGVEQTSDRILDFAKALSGGDVNKADELLDAFKKGFDEATKAWGRDLPDISKETYKAVEEKFEAWKKEAEAPVQNAPVENPATKIEA